MCLLSVILVGFLNEKFQSQLLGFFFGMPCAATAKVSPRITSISVPKPHAVIGGGDLSDDQFFPSFTFHDPSNDTP